MQKVNTFVLFMIGRHLGPLYALEGSEVIGDVMQDFTFASAMAGVVINGPSSPSVLRLGSCVNAAKRLRDHIDALCRRESTQLLSEYDIETLKGNLARFEGALQSELSESPTFFVPPRGIYNTTALIDKAETVFSQAILDRLPAEAIADLRQAGRALSFDLPTASGFHGCRAVESVVKKQIVLFSGAAPKTTNWGYYCQALNEHGADKRVADSIYRLKEGHRNPLIHPEVTLNMQEAITLFAVCQSAIQMCVVDMEQKNASPSAEILEMLPPPEPPEGVA